MIRVLDLFSCVGAHALGLSRVRLNGLRVFETVAFCESRPFRRDVLARHWPDVQVFPDVRELSAEQVPHDPRYPLVVFGGPPCQATSSISAISGSRSGESLVGFQVGLGDDLGADWIVVEQPPGHALWEVGTAESLALRGYHVGRVEFGASDLGAPYQRRRVFLLACAELRGLEVAVQSVPEAVRAVGARAAGEDPGRPWDTGVLRTLRVAREFAPRVDGSGRVSRDPDGGLRRDRIEAIGDSNPPEMAEVVGRAIAAAHGLSPDP